MVPKATAPPWFLLQCEVDWSLPRILIKFLQAGKKKKVVGNH